MAPTGVCESGDVTLILKERTFECTECGSKVKVLKWNYEPPPECHGPMVPYVDPFRQSAAVIQDSIPGGLLIEHGICHPDGTPKRYDSKSDIREAARRQGWVQSGDTPQLPGDRWV